MAMRTSKPNRDAWSKPDMGYLLYSALHGAGVLGSTLLMTWGLFVLFFAAIGGFSLAGVMHQLANLSNRYLAADADRITQFRALVFGLHLIVGGTILFLRRDNLPPRDPLPREQNA